MAGFWADMKAHAKGEDIARVKVIGVRTAQQTKVMTTYNYGVYSFLVEYVDGTIEIEEEELGSPRMGILKQHLVFK